MKHNKILRIALGLTILVSTIVVISCSEKDTTQPAQPIETTSDFEASIQHFMKHWLQPYKTSSNMYIDDALDSLELALNYNYGDATFQFSEFIMDTSLVQCQQLYDSISNYDLLAAYNKCVDSLKAQYKRVDASSKQLVYALVKIDTIIGSTVSINVIGGFGNGASTNWNFQSSDDWKACFLMGKCDGTCFGSDGAEEIEKKVHFRKPSLNGNWIVYNFESFHEINPETTPDNPFDNTPHGDGYRDYILYYEYDTPPTSIPCLDEDELNFYLQSIEWYLNTNEPTGLCPNNKSFVSINLFGDAMFPTPASIWQHTIPIVTFAKYTPVNHAPASLQ